MGIKIIRAGQIVLGIAGGNKCDVRDNVALAVENDLIVEIASFQELSARYPSAPVIGSSTDIAIPGLVNAHHHVGLTPFQLGTADLPLELWAIARMGSRDVDPYLDTLYSAFELISSGVTTVQHICDTVEGSVEEVKRRLDRIIEAYQDVGMRASVCYGLADQNHLVHEANSTFLARLPNEISVPLAKVLEAVQTGLEGGLEIFAQLHSEYSSNRRLRVQLAPANLHWCSDRALSMIADVAQRYRAQLHMHLLETPYQRAYSNRRNPAGALAHLRDFGLLTPSLTLGHGVWLNDFEIGLLADAGCSICINCSSNLRLSSGVARLKKLEASGINTAIGIDEAGLNDDRDMLLEMRIVHSLNNDPGLESLGPTSCQILRMATVGGALTTGFSDKVGALEVGRAADIVLFDREALTEPHVDERQPVADLILRRAKPGHVRSVICGGRIIYEDGRFSEVDREQILTELRSQLSQDLSEGERMKRDLSRALLPHVRRHFALNYPQVDVSR